MCLYIDRSAAFPYVALLRHHAAVHTDWLPDKAQTLNAAAAAAVSAASGNDNGRKLHPKKTLSQHRSGLEPMPGRQQRWGSKRSDWIVIRWSNIGVCHGGANTECIPRHSSASPHRSAHQKLLSNFHSCRCCCYRSFCAAVPLILFTRYFGYDYSCYFVFVRFAPGRSTDRLKARRWQVWYGAKVDRLPSNWRMSSREIKRARAANNGSVFRLLDNSVGRAAIRWHRASQSVMEQFCALCFTSIEKTSQGKRSTEWKTRTKTTKATKPEKHYRPNLCDKKKELLHIGERLQCCEMDTHVGKLVRGRGGIYRRCKWCLSLLMMRTNEEWGRTNE